GTVVGSEVGEGTAEPARLTVRSEGLGNVSIVVDDVFESRLPERSFDLVHARLLLGPLGRHREQLATFRRLVRPGGWLVLEETDGDTWRFNPEAPACQRLMELVVANFVHRGRDLNVGRQLRSRLREHAEKPEVRRRDGRTATRYSPELGEPPQPILPRRCVVDGEAVIIKGDRLEFESLLLRIHPAESGVNLPAAEIPASFVAFDLLALDDES